MLLRLTLRQLAKAPGFSIAVVLMLAFGIGATTAIFSLVEGILLRPLPFHDPDRLALLGDHVGDETGIGVTAREIGIYASAAHAYSSLGGYTGATFELSGGDTPETVNAARLTAGVFPTLGVQPLLGRVFTRAEDEAREPLAVLSFALWTTRYHRDPHVVGSSITLDRKTYTVIGVMPRNFEFPLQAGRVGQAQLWVPMSLSADELSEQNVGNWRYQMVGRLNSGVTLAQAAQDTDRVAKEIMRGFPAGMAEIHIRGDADDLRDRSVSEARPLLRILLSAACVVLLIACVNVAILMLVRAIRRRHESAVRIALGARSATILRGALFEGLLLSAAGGLLGLALGDAAMRIAVSVLPESMPRIDSIRMDTAVAAFALLLALATGALCSLVPAFADLRGRMIESLRDSARTASGSPSHAWLRSSLVVLEIATALVLLAASGAFLRSYQKMIAVDPGYRSDHVLIAGYQLPARQYATDAAIETFNRTLLDRLSAQPGVVAASLANALPASDSYGMAAYTAEGQTSQSWKLKFAPFEVVSSDYFRTMGISLLAGRTFNAGDRAGSPLVVIVNESMARHSWPGQRALGKRMHVGNPEKGLPWATVVGVAADTRLGSRDEPGGDQFFCPIDQPEFLFGPSTGQPEYLSGGYIALRAVLPPEQMEQTLRSVVASIDPQLALTEVRPMTDAVSEIEAPRRFNTGLIAGFALAALLLAITGIYAVVAFSVSLRAQEIAIRMALGAQRSSIARLVLVSGAKLALFGCGCGVLGSVAASRLIRSFLFNESPTDPLIYMGSALIMILLAMLASALPARRAASADPIEALRSV
ncbi:MAG TPA: ABC transporter permease [Terracidiphilus sp.]|nr:ABC transporter permease [Terracidiphilus sp.]